MSSQQKKNTFFGSAAILAATTILVKIIGAIYKIPLTALLPDAAYGDFNGAYNIYNFFLTISTAGLPVALSKTVTDSTLPTDTPSRAPAALSRSRRSMGWMAEPRMSMASPSPNSSLHRASMI